MPCADNAGTVGTDLETSESVFLQRDRKGRLSWLSSLTLTRARKNEARTRIRTGTKQIKFPNRGKLQLRNLGDQPSQDEVGQRFRSRRGVEVTFQVDCLRRHGVPLRE